MYLIQGILNAYSTYTGIGIINVLFFVGLVYMALTDNNRSNRTLILYGSIALVCVIFSPPVFYCYDRFVDEGTYWRMWWMVPAGIGLAYVAAKIINSHRLTGFLLALFILVLGGNLVYTADEDYKLAENPYQIPNAVIDIVDYLEDYEPSVVRVAVPYELITYVRMYDPCVSMPYGREQFGGPWGVTSGFYILMNSPNIDFRKLSDKCLYNDTKYIVIQSGKFHIGNPEDYDFKYLITCDNYDIYEYTGDLSH